ALLAVQSRCQKAAHRPPIVAGPGRRVEATNAPNQQKLLHEDSHSLPPQATAVPRCLARDSLSAIARVEPPFRFFPSAVARISIGRARVSLASTATIRRC